MGFFDFFRGKPAAPAQSSTALSPRASASGEIFDLTDPRVGEFLRGGVSTSSGAFVSPEIAMRGAVVFRCVDLISGAIATLPMDLKRRIDDKVRKDATDHSLWKVLRKKPNSWQTPSEFKKMQQASVLTRGNAYALIIRSLGVVTQLIPMPASRMVVRQLPDLSIVYTYTRPDGTVMVLPQSDVFHLRGLSLDGITGISVISMARETIGLASQTEKHAAALFKNGATAGTKITSPESIDASMAERLKASLEEYRGAENAHKTLILGDGLQFDEIGMNSVDAQFLQQREFGQYEIAMFFGVPPHMLGLTSKSTSFGAGIENQSMGFATYTLQPHMTMWDEGIGRDLIEDAEPTMYAKINPAGLVRGDIKTRYDAYLIGRQGEWLSANDVRSLEDMDPIPGGDDYTNPMVTPATPAGDNPPAPPPAK